MAEATDKKTDATPKVTETVPGPIDSGKGSADQNSTGSADAGAASGIDLGTLIWLAVGLAAILVLWRKGYIAVIRKFIGETREQLHKCTWPTMDELRQHIVVVMISSILLGLFTVFCDKIVYFIVWDLLLAGGSSS